MYSTGEDSYYNNFKLLLSVKKSVTKFKFIFRHSEVFLHTAGFGVNKFISVTQLCLTLRPHELQHARLPYSSLSSRVCSDSSPLSQWCHQTISSSIVPFSSCPQSFPASGSFQMIQFSASGGQSIGVSASASVLPVNIQDWFPLGLIDWISLQSKGLSRVFSNTTVQSINSSALSLLYGPVLNSHVHMVQLSHPYMTTGKTTALTIWTFVHRCVHST